MKRIWDYRFYILTILGQIITWCSIADTWHNNTHFALMLIGMAVSFVGVVLQLTIAPNFDVTPPKKLKTFELTEEGQIDGISLDTVSSEDSKFAIIVQTREGNFHNLGTDGKFHHLPKTEQTK